MENVEKPTNPELFDTLPGTYEELETAARKIVSDNRSLVLENESLRIQNEEFEAKIKFYEEQIRLATAQKYGSSSEKNITEAQLFMASIFNEAEKESRPDAYEPTIEEITYKRKRGVRKPTIEKYDGLPIVEIHYELSEEELACGHCGMRMKEIGIEIHDELVCHPAIFEIRRHIQHKYACEDETCEVESGSTNIVMARAPEPPIPHSPAGASLLAYIISRKYSEHLPLYRQEKQFGYEGITISRQNMANWMIKCAILFMCIYNRLHWYMLQDRYLHADETPIQVLSEPGKKATSHSYMWVYLTSKYRKRIILYEYSRSREGGHPKKFLKGFSGFLQTDAYSGYNGLDNVVNIYCFQHVRRKFTDALKALPKGADKSKTITAEGIAYIDKLFALEREYESMTPDQRYEARLKKTQPVLDAYHAWLTEKKLTALPQGKLAVAINYPLTHWDTLCAFMKDGEIEISNNDAENAVRPFAVGRRNWLFAKTPNGASSSAVLFSIVETAKVNGLIPFEYLKFLLEMIPNINVTNTDALDALLPWSESLPENVRLRTATTDTATV
jgi:transposase